MRVKITLPPSRTVPSPFFHASSPLRVTAMIWSARGSVITLFLRASVLSPMFRPTTGQLTHQLSKNPSQVLAKLSIQHLPSAFRNPYQMILAFPDRVAYTLNVAHDSLSFPFLWALVGSHWKALHIPKIVKRFETPGLSGGLVDKLCRFPGRDGLRFRTAP